MLCKFHNCTKSLNDFETFSGGYCFKHQLIINKAMYKVKIYRYNGSIDIWEEIRTIVIDETQYNKYIVEESKPPDKETSFYKYDIYLEDVIKKTLYYYSPQIFS